MRGKEGWAGKQRCSGGATSAEQSGWRRMPGGGAGEEVAEVPLGRKNLAAGHCINPTSSVCTQPLAEASRFCLQSRTQHSPRGSHRGEPAVPPGASLFQGPL